MACPSLLLLLTLNFCHERVQVGDDAIQNFSLTKNTSETAQKILRRRLARVALQHPLSRWRRPFESSCLQFGSRRLSMPCSSSPLPRRLGLYIWLFYNPCFYRTARPWASEFAWYYYFHGPSRAYRFCRTNSSNAYEPACQNIPRQLLNTKRETFQNSIYRDRNIRYFRKKLQPSAARHENAQSLVVRRNDLDGSCSYPRLNKIRKYHRNTQQITIISRKYLCLSQKKNSNFWKLSIISDKFS